MSTIPRLARVLATRTSSGIEIAIEDGDGEVFKVLASDDQVDRLVDELDELLGAADQAEASPA